MSVSNKEEFPSPDVDAIINELVEGGLPAASKDMFADMPSRSENLAHDLGQLPLDQRGFFGIHYVTGEDGHIMKDPDGLPVRRTDLPEDKGGRRNHSTQNPFSN